METLKWTAISKILEYERISALKYVHTVCALKFLTSCAEAVQKQQLLELEPVPKPASRKFPSLPLLPPSQELCSLWSIQQAMTPFLPDLRRNGQLRDLVASSAESMFGQVAHPSWQLQGIYKDRMSRKRECFCSSQFCINPLGHFEQIFFFSPALLQIIKKLIERKQAQIRKVYPGLSCFKDGVRQIPIESIPGISMYQPLLM